MINRELDSALRQAVASEFAKMNYPCYHSSNNVWGIEVIVSHFENETYKELRGKIETYTVSLFVDDNTDLQALAKEFVTQAEKIEQKAYNEALGKWSETYPIDILRETMECHELCGWSLLAHDGEGVIYHGRATAVHYALYLPNLRKIHEKYTKREINHEN